MFWLSLLKLLLKIVWFLSIFHRVSDYFFLHGIYPTIFYQKTDICWLWNISLALKVDQNTFKCLHTWLSFIVVLRKTFAKSLNRKNGLWRLKNLENVFDSNKFRNWESFQKRRSRSWESEAVLGLRVRYYRKLLKTFRAFKNCFFYLKNFQRIFADWLKHLFRFPNIRKIFSSIF